MNQNDELRLSDPVFFFNAVLYTVNFLYSGQPTSCAGSCSYVLELLDNLELLLRLARAVSM
jgi:hypothetical protein